MYTNKTHIGCTLLLRARATFERLFVACFTHARVMHAQSMKGCIAVI